MTMRVFAAWLALLLALPTPALAWGDYGHRTIAQIAEANISPKAKARMNALFRAEKLLATPDCPLRNIGDASVWADCVRRDDLRWGYTAPWHYINMDICKPFDIKANCANGNCVGAQVARNEKLLADKRLPAHVRLEALAWLVHTMGDMHQPMHGGDRGDLGGNRVSAAYGIVEGRMNLHRLWDTPVAERAITQGEPMVRRYAAAERSPYLTGTVEDWALESWSIARDIAYPTAQHGPACGPTLKPGERARHDDGDIETLVPVVRQQVLRAGLRLADALERALG
ncbi:MAG: S1/P1 nuclease [Blastomonas fulva]|uniref:S1/P1 nuclease n=1 Tax=Blastomonas fulva TaxID=1550728 RepID=UPI0024E2245F|nr:S1/P1 nuclease [Blastomonas fulva]MDK2758953.1 S1/P1 nuclease [Blastomonas fulva]